MLHRNRTDLPREVYPDDPWAIVEEAFAPRFLYLTETIFSLSNGYLGIRGTLDEGEPSHQFGTFINGFHETWPIEHPEAAFGFAKLGQTIVNVPDATIVEVAVDGEMLHLPETPLGGFRRWLDFRRGVLEREVRWRTSDGVEAVARSRRMVSLVEPHLAVIQTTVEVDRPARVDLTSRIVNRQDLEMPDPTAAGFDPRRGKAFGRRVLEPAAHRREGTRLLQSWVTNQSRLAVVVGADHLVEGSPEQVEVDGDGDIRHLHLVFSARPGEAISLTKLVAYHTATHDALDEAMAAADATLDRGRRRGVEALWEDQRRELTAFWERADIEVDAGPEVQRAVRWTLFQLHQASALVPEGASIPAKGLSGQAYDGHYFWDTEIYVLPFLIYTDPHLAARILRFRHSLLPAARRRAAELSQKGALFPWRTITGEEASAYYEAGTAQYHIDADVVYALRKYVEVTGDVELLWDIGVELAVETARMWVDLGFFRGGRFRIHGVTGPDEYSALVDDNAYTNLMARMNLRYAAEVAERMRREQPDRYQELAEQLGLTAHEVVDWRLAADAMYVPHDPELGVTAQDDDFLEKQVWDFAATPANKYPLLLHFHPLVIYRFQVLKQADVVLATFLLGNEFSAWLKKANFDYYDPLTTGDSSLSASIQSVMASEIGYHELAMEYFLHALYMDLADLAGNTTDGVHMAAAGGVWLALLYGFAGMRDHRGAISFEPRLPPEWKRLRAKICVRGSRIEVELTPGQLSLRLAAGDPVTVSVGSRSVEVLPEPVKVALDG